MAPKEESTSPNWSGVIFAGMASFILGAVLGVVSMVSQPVKVLSDEPDPESIKPGEVYYIRGDRISRSSWRAKEEAWRAGQIDRLILSEAELNKWSEVRLKAETSKDEETDSGWFDLEVNPVNFRFLDDNRIQLVTQLKLPGVLPGTTVHYRVIGQFVESGEGVVFVPQEGTLGRAPLGSLPVTREYLFNMVSRRFSELEDTDWIVASLHETRSAEVSNGQLVLERDNKG